MCVYQQKMPNKKVISSKLFSLVLGALTLAGLLPGHVQAEEESLLENIKKSVKDYLPTKPEAKPSENPPVVISDRTPPATVLLVPPAPTVFSDSVTVQFSLPEPDPTFKEYRFTLDGSDPTCKTGILGDHVQINLTTKLKVIACDLAGNRSEKIAGGTYTKTLPINSSPSPAPTGAVAVRPGPRPSLRPSIKSPLVATKSKEIKKPLATPTPKPTSSPAVTPVPQSPEPPVVTLLPTPPVSFENTLIVSFSLSSSQYMGFKEYRFTTDGISSPKCPSKEKPNGIGKTDSEITLHETTTIQVIACSQQNRASSKITTGTYTKAKKGETPPSEPAPSRSEPPEPNLNPVEI